MRTQLGVTVGLGKGFQLTAGVPLDWRQMTIQSQIDGEPYEPVYTDRDRWSSSVVGLSDMRMAGWRYGYLADRVLYGIGVGVVLPTGNTESQVLGPPLEAISRRPLRLGSGVVSPTLHWRTIWMGDRWGFWGAVDGTLSLYETEEDQYRPGNTGTLSVGPSYKLTKKLQAVWTVDGIVQSPERFEGEPIGGRVAMGTSLSGLWSISNETVLQAQVRGDVLQWSLDDTQTLNPGVVTSIGVTWTPNLHRPHGPEPGAPAD